MNSHLLLGGLAALATVAVQAQPSQPIARPTEPVDVAEGQTRIEETGLLLDGSKAAGLQASKAGDLPGNAAFMGRMRAFSDSDMTLPVATRLWSSPKSENQVKGSGSS